MTREEIGEKYLSSLPYPPYPVQEEALLSWFMCEEGVLIAAPTGTGKTLIAQGALFEGLHLGKTVYYTTPLIALTEQKFHEVQEAAVQWGFSAEDVGLVTGNRKVNPQAKLLIVVAEILLNRLLDSDAFPFDDVHAVVMDEFHSFNDPERGVVWELSLGMLPKHVRLMLLSATVGNAAEFIVWLQRSHGRRVDYVHSETRKVPLTYHWVADRLLGEQLEFIAQGNDEERRVPALVFCFNRDECWNVAEQIKGLDLLSPQQREPLHQQIEREDWSKGAGGKLRQLLWRGVGVHHAGLLPKYRRIVEKLFLGKMIPILLCTETLSAGLNLPARSVVMTELLKGPFGDRKLINASVAHQIFGRAGRPGFDDQGHVYAMAHEDDVKILRWENKLRTFPENPKDPGMIKAKKAHVRKKPTRRSNVQYWTEAQFQKLIQSPPSHLASHGPIPWRLLAYLLASSPDVTRLTSFASKRLLDAGRMAARQRELIRMLITLHQGGYVELEPSPPVETAEGKQSVRTPVETPRGLLEGAGLVVPIRPSGSNAKVPAIEPAPSYVPVLARSTPRLDRLVSFRSIHPIYGDYLADMLVESNEAEKLQALESVLTMPRPLLKFMRPPSSEEMPPGPMETTRLNPALEELGLLVSHVADESNDDDDESDDEGVEEYKPTLADKLRLLFDARHPGIHDLQTQSIWSAAAILSFGGDFDKYVRTFNLVKQEGIVFRHLLRLILLCGEFAAIEPSEGSVERWRTEWGELASKLTLAARSIDPITTLRTIKNAHADDLRGAASQTSSKNETWEDQWDSMLSELLPPDPEQTPASSAGT